MAEKNKKNPPAEIRIEIDGVEVTAVPGQYSAGVDRVLKQRGAESFVFIPLAKLDKKGKRLLQKPAAIARKKTKLPADEWHDGAMHSLEDDHAAPGVLAFDVRRHAAREIAAAVGVKQFVWGAVGVPVEAHDARLFEDKGGRTWKAARGRAFTGLADMADALRNLDALPTAVKESQTTMDKFWQLVALVLVAAVAAGGGKAILFALLDSNPTTSWLATVAVVVFYPFVIPAALVGIYLRVLMKRGEQQARDFTAAEAEQNWIKVAPHLLALWALCWVAIVLLTWVQSVPSVELGVLGRTDGVTTSLVICVWMLLPIANSHDMHSLIKSGFESAITAAVSIFTIKLSLYITNLITDVLLEIVTAMLPFHFPEALQAFISAAINIGAEVFLVAVLLGYAWTQTRQQFMRL